MLCAISLATLLKFSKFQFHFNHEEYVDFTILAPFMWTLFASQRNLYKIVRTDTIDKQIRKVLYGVFIYYGYLFIIVTALNFDEISRLWLFYFVFFLIPFLLLGRIGFHKVILFYRRKGGNYRTVIIVGNDRISRELYHHFNSNLALGYKVLGYFKPYKQVINKDVYLNMNDLGYSDSIIQYLKENKPDEVFWEVGGEEDPFLKETINYCEDNLIRLKLIPNFGVPISGRQPNIDLFRGIPLVTLRREPLILPTNLLSKRIFDVVFSFLALIILVPFVFPCIAILIKLNSKGPVFFKQLRSGVNNEIFWCYKFRTMVVNVESDHLQATKGDMRITRVGKYLRKTSLDELPQFYNVLCGEMSVVGPRPHMLKHTEDYSALISKFLVRHFAKPGITGWAQVHGLRGETATIQDIQKRVEADIWYVENWSLILDFRIVFMTVRNMFLGDERAF